MKLLPKLVLALVTIGSCAAAGAQMSDQADQERRARNRAEALANYERMHPGANSNMSQSSGMQPRENVRERAHEDAQKTRSFTHRQAQKTRSFTHRQADKLRHFSARQNRRTPGPAHEVAEPNKAPAALGK